MGVVTESYLTEHINLEKSDEVSVLAQGDDFNVYIQNVSVLLIFLFFIDLGLCNKILCLVMNRSDISIYHYGVSGMF